MQFTSISSQTLKQQFIDLHRDIFDAADFDDAELIDALFEHWVESLLDDGTIQPASMNN